MKKPEWVHPDKMLIRTGHRTFDLQTNLITTGNVVANTQHGHYIRGKLVTACLGDHVYEPGYLRYFDLSSNFPGIPWRPRTCVLKHTEGGQSVWVGKFFHYSGRKQIVHGYIVTTPDHKLLGEFVTGPTVKSILVIKGVLPYTVEEDTTEKSAAGEVEE